MQRGGEHGRHSRGLDKRLRLQHVGARPVACHERQYGLLVVGGGQVGSVAAVGRDRHQLRADSVQRSGLAQPGAQHGEPVQRRRPQRRPIGVGVQRATQPAHPLLDQASGHPEPPRARGQPQRLLGVVDEGHSERHAEIVVLVGEPPRRLAHDGPGPVRVEASGPIGVVVPVPAPALHTFCAIESRRGVLPDDLEQSVTPAGRAEMGDHQRLVDQPGQGVDGVGSNAVAQSLTASRSNPPANTDRRRNSPRSMSVSSAWLQPIVAASVCWRSRPPGGP